MRRFLSFLFIVLVLVVSATGAAPVAHAASCTAGYTPDNTGFAGVQLDRVTPCTVDASSPSPATDEAATLAKIAADKAAGGSKTDIPEIPKSVEGFGVVMAWIMSLFAWLVGVAAITLDNAVYYTIVSMGSYVSHLSAIGVTWRILRDIGNIMLIFGFLAIGITIILNVNWYGSATKMLPMLLIAAVFLNFSLFISEAVIDTGNLFATQFYKQINGGTPVGSKSYNDIAGEGISNKIMGQLGLQNIYTAGRTNTAVFQAGNTWIIGFMGIILFLVTALVLFALAFILVARFVALIFIIILAPIGFAGLAVPQLAGRAKQWWSALFEQTITAPVLLLMLYIALAVITDAKFLTGFCVTTDPANPTCTPNWIGYLGSNFGGFAAMILTFLVAMGLLLAVIIQAKKLSAFGAGLAIKAATAATFGATAYGASALVGGGAFAARRGLQRFAPNSRTARALSNYALRPLERAKFDIRSIGGGAALGAIGLGEAAAPIGASAVGRGKQAAEGARKFGEESNRDFDRETRMPRLNAAIAANDNETITRILGNMSDKELEESSMQRLLANPANSSAMAALPQNRFEKLMTSDVLNDGQKNNLRARRQAGLTARYSDATVYHNPASHPTAPGATIPSVAIPGTDMSRGEQAVRALSNEAASQLTDASLLEPAVHENLSIRQLTAIRNAGKIQDTTAATVGTFLQGDATFVAHYMSRNTQQRADLRSFWGIPISPFFPV